MRYYTLLFLAFLLFNALDAQAQASTPNKGFQKERVILGGNMGVNFTNNNAYVLISPIIGYYITPKYSAGLGPTFEYFKSGNFSTNAYGGRIFNRLQILPNLFLHGEYEQLSYKSLDNNSARAVVKRFPVGGGYSQQLIGRSQLNIMVLYDLLYNPDSPYNNSQNGFIFRGGVTFGL